MLYMLKGVVLHCMSVLWQCRNAHASILKTYADSYIPRALDTAFIHQGVLARDRHFLSSHYWWDAHLPLHSRRVQDNSCHHGIPTAALFRITLNKAVTHETAKCGHAASSSLPPRLKFKLDQIVRYSQKSQTTPLT